MRQLTSVDTQFLALETSRQTGHVGGLAILDPSTAPGGKLELADMCRLMEERLPLLPPMRWRLVEVPFGLDYPYWVEDDGFDLDFHVRELALPAPGDRNQLAEQVARIMARRLDRTSTRPRSTPSPARAPSLGSRGGSAGSGAVRERSSSASTCGRRGPP